MRPIICALLLTTLAGAACTKMQAVTLDQMSLLGPERIWVTEHDQSVVLMYEPKVVRDTLTGYIGRHREKMSSARVKEVRVQTKATTRTALLVGGLTVGFAGLLVLAGSNGQSAVIVSRAGPPGDCEQDPDQAVCTGVPDPSSGAR
jgi:hypothetical protein